MDAISGEHSKLKLSKRKKVLFWCLMLFFVWLVLDGFAYVLVDRFYVFNGFKKPTGEEIAKFHEELFHPRWGWDLQPKDNRGPLGNRIGREYEPKEAYMIKTFGDSFTQGAVENDETFQYLIEEETGWSALNYGVGGYGTDQALFKYQDTTVKTKYTILGILDENIGRVVMTSWRFYQPGGFWPKPRFAIADDGSIFLIDNPVKNYADLQKLNDGRFIESLKENDYWFAHLNVQNIPLGLRWPATLTVVPHLDYLVKSFTQKFKQRFLGPPGSWRKPRRSASGSSPL